MTGSTVQNTVVLLKVYYRFSENRVVCDESAAYYINCHMDEARYQHDEGNRKISTADCVYTKRGER